MILVLSLADDPVAREGERRLRARGADVLLFDSRTLPESAQLHLGWDAQGVRHGHLISAEGRAVDLSSIRAVWHRRAMAGRPSAIRDPMHRKFVEEETDRVLWYLWSALEVPFLPAPLPVLRKTQEKLLQLDLAGRLGFAIPPTLVTNDPGEVLAFLRRHSHRCITKHLSSSSMTEAGMDATFMRFTEPITHRDMAAVSAVRLCPTFVQAYVDKRLELRVTVVGERVFAAEIHSQTSAHSRYDWRKYDHSRTPYFVHRLPREVEERCLRLTHALGLRYGALDLILTPDGRYVFLEINPAGEYQWVEARTGLPITDAICDLLVSLAQGTKS
jgi:glutathione synthase/RimK-type ligase-like ATP-grasp enzyme